MLLDDVICTLVDVFIVDHLNKFGFMHYFISWDGNEDDDLGKETTLPQLAPNECVFSPCHRSFYYLPQQMDDFFP